MACSSQLSGIVRRASLGTFLGAIAAMLFAVSSSCIATTNPEFEQPVQTPPVILQERVTPDPRSIIVIQNMQQEIIFTGAIRSEDVGEQVEVRLLLDYGTSNSLGRPYLDSTQGIFVGASTWDDTDRSFDLPLFLPEFPMAPGCHRFTMMAAHEFKDNVCPAPDDFDTVTWTVIVCDAAGCPDIDGANPELSCPSLQTSCSTLSTNTTP